MKRLTYTFLISLSLFIFSCSTSTTNNETKDKQTDSVKTQNSNEVTTKVTESQANDETSQTYKLLQGQWQNEQDMSNEIVFEKNHRKEIVFDKNHKTNGFDDNEFILSDRCMNASNSNSDVPKEKDKYISLVKEDMCWYIVKINATTLELSYMGRGNTLVYKKVVITD